LVPSPFVQLVVPLIAHVLQFCINGVASHGETDEVMVVCGGAKCFRFWLKRWNQVDICHILGGVSADRCFKSLQIRIPVA
jgi:hypothetical protein